MGNRNPSLDQKDLYRWCPDCQQYHYTTFADQYPPHPSTPFTGTDRCPMCGETIEDYLAHITEDCEGGSNGADTRG